MNETEWLASDDPEMMLKSLNGKASDRKLRLFAVACCRRIWKLIADERCYRALDISERCAEGSVSLMDSYNLGQELELYFNPDLAEHLANKTGSPLVACNYALGAIGLIHGYLNPIQTGNVARNVSTAVVLQVAPHLADYDYDDQDAFEADAFPLRIEESAVQAELLRDIFGNPFRQGPYLFSQNLDSKEKAVQELAQAVYDSGQLPVGNLDHVGLASLADALLDAGHDRDLIAHFREPGPHIRGCWALDVILGKNLMVEVEWLASTDIKVMLEFLRQIGKFTVRKSRLFGVAICHRIWHLLHDERSRNAVEVAERYGDGAATIADSNAAYKGAFEASVAVPKTESALKSASHAAAEVAHHHELAENVARKATEAVGTAEENEIHAQLLRCLFGNPLRPVSFDPTWRTQDVVSLARSIYDDRAFERLPELAHALRQAGCTEPSILDHCREIDLHVKGCWVVDLILGTG